MRRQSTPRPMVGEACAHVQGESLKAHAALLTEASQLPDHQGRGEESWEFGRATVRLSLYSFQTIAGNEDGSCDLSQSFKLL